MDLQRFTVSALTVTVTETKARGSKSRLHIRLDTGSLCGLYPVGTHKPGWTCTHTHMHKTNMYSLSHAMVDLQSWVVKAGCVVMNLQQLCITNQTVVVPATEIMMLHTSATPLNLQTHSQERRDPTLPKHSSCKLHTVISSSSANR